MPLCSRCSVARSASTATHRVVLALPSAPSPSPSIQLACSFLQSGSRVPCHAAGWAVRGVQIARSMRHPFIRLCQSYLRFLHLLWLAF